MKKVAKERMLIPPNCISTSRMMCPVVVKLSAVLTEVSPVTQLALVAVKSASAKVMPLVVAFGMSNSSVPIEISRKNDTIISSGGLMLIFFRKALTLASSTKKIIR